MLWDALPGWGFGGDLFGVRDCAEELDAVAAVVVVWLRLATLPGTEVVEDATAGVCVDGLLIGRIFRLASLSASGFGRLGLSNCRH